MQAIVSWHSLGPGALDAGLEVIANRFGKRLDADSPILKLRLPDGSRLAAMIPPVVNPNPLITIRRFTSRNFTMNDLVSKSMLNPEQANMLTERVRRGDNILIAGGTGSGKTTLLNVLADAIPDEDRILVIEDTAAAYSASRKSSPPREVLVTPLRDIRQVAYLKWREATLNVAFGVILEFLLCYFMIMHDVSLILTDSNPSIGQSLCPRNGRRIIQHSSPQAGMKATSLGSRDRKQYCVDNQRSDW